MNRFSRMPFFVQLLLVVSLAMMVPAVYGVTVAEFAEARAFFYAGLMFGTIGIFIAIALFRPDSLREHKSRHAVELEGRNQLLVLVGAYTVLPLILAVPFKEATPDTTYFNAYFEMVSSLTTTGASLFEQEGRLASSVHLWRATVGWLGGFFAWVTAVAVLAPLSLGGFEVLTARQLGQDAAGASQIVRVAAVSERVEKYTNRLFPVYLGLTIALWLALSMVGSTPYVALCHAMSVLSTSGISPVGGISEANGGFYGEVLVLAFLFLALSRKTFTTDQPRPDAPPLFRDPELRIAAFLILVLPFLMFVRHWGAAIEIDDVWNFDAAIASLWGSLFMVVSFLTTAGFESASWETARTWSGLQAPGLMLVGLAIFGGGVATTAGGVKLLRLYALVKHGEREIEKLISPNSVGGSGANARRIRRDGAYVAWVYFMVFAFSIAAGMILLSLFGLHFEEAAVFSISALTTTGPLVHVAAEVPYSYADLTTGPKVILAVAMVLGRLEMLAFIALLSPDFWRR